MCIHIVADPSGYEDIAGVNGGVVHPLPHLSIEPSLSFNTANLIHLKLSGVACSQKGRLFPPRSSSSAAAACCTVSGKIASTRFRVEGLRGSIGRRMLPSFAAFKQSPIVSTHSHDLRTGPGENAKRRFLPARMFRGFLAPSCDRLCDTNYVILVERNQNHRIRARIEGEPLSRACLAIAHRLIDFGKGLHIALMKQLMHPFFQRRAKDQHQHLHRSPLHPLFIKLDRVGPGRHSRKSGNRHATLRGDLLETSLESLAGSSIFRLGRQQPL